VILAVAGSAVGLGNFLRFPGQAAEYGGGAFMLAYFISFLIIGLPLVWTEWTMGRLGGKNGFHSCPGILNAIARHPAAKYLGVIGLVIPIMIYMYYVNIEAWCLGYAVNFLRGEFNFASPAESGAFFGNFIGAGEDGSAIGFGWKTITPYLIFAFLLNFILIYRGIYKGIEFFCRYAMPLLLLLAVVILVRVLTLGAPDASQPENSVNNGLGFLWNPNKVTLEVATVDEEGALTWEREQELVGAIALRAAADLVASSPETHRIVEISAWQQLSNPQLWLAAAGQIFFSLSIGFGIILTYASYMRENDDVVLSGLSAASTNQFAEVALGGLITIPAAVAFIGVAGVAGMGTFGLGFNVLPLVFSEMPGGNLFGFLFFFLLFLAAVTSSLSMLQPGIAFMETAVAVNREQSVAIIGIITALGTMFVFYFSQDLKALDTLDFWIGTFFIFILATTQITIFAWVYGAKRGIEEANRGSLIRIPKAFHYVMTFICPAFLLTIFACFILFNVLGLSFGGEPAQVSSYVLDLVGENKNPVAIMSVLFIVLMFAFFTLLVMGVDRYRDFLENKAGGKSS
jgi:NSS family neurotransmitter:Na+ symporter